MDRIRLRPYFAAFLAFALVWFLGMTLGGLHWAREDIAASDASATASEDVTLKASEALIDAYLNMRPGCDEESLTELRRREYASDYVTDLAIVDESNRAICTSTLGVLKKPMAAFTPDYAFSLNGHVIQVTNAATDYFGNAQRKLTMGRLGRFQASLSPQAMARIDPGAYTAFAVLQPDSSITVIGGKLFDAKDKDALDELTSRRLVWQVDSRGFSWRHMAIESIRNVRGTQFVYYQRSPLYALEATSIEYRLTMLLVAFTISMLAHAAATARAEKLSSMLYRIDRLLNEQNIRTVYQPIVDIRARRIIGCEVLVRLQDGAQLLTPDKFLDEVVKKNLSWTLDRLVITRSLTELRQNLPPGEPFEIALNLFPRNVRADRLIALIQDQLDWKPKDGHTINLEVIEHEYKDEMLTEVEALKRAGFKVCVDDFGTGYSNLASVKKIKPDFLKIDRSFVQDMETDTVRSTLIPEIVSIARVTGAAVVAEGIEKEDQLDALDGLGVEYGQGYFLGKPMPLSAFMARLNQEPRKVVSLASRRIAAEGGGASGLQPVPLNPS